MLLQKHTRKFTLWVMKNFSAIDAFHEKFAAELVEIEGTTLPLRYASGVDQDIRTIQTTAGILDFKSFHMISLKGIEAAQFIQGMVSNDVNQIQIGQIQPNLLSNHKGRILYEVKILRVSENEYILFTNPGEGPYVGVYLDHFHIQEELELKLLLPDYLRCDLLGPCSGEALSDLGYSGEMEWRFQEQRMRSCSSMLGEIPHFINIVPQYVFVDFLTELSNGSHGLQLTGFDAYDHIRIDAGIPRFGVDYTQENFPQEAALMDHISYQKGCYIGQETHARMYHRGHPNWQSVGLIVPHALQLQEGQSLFHDQEEIGKITSLSRIVRGTIRRGIGYLKYRRVLQKISLAIKAGEKGEIKQYPLPTTVQRLN